MISIIIPFKYDSKNRLENILELLNYSKKYWNFEKIILVEMDENPKIINLIPNWCAYVFCKEENETWSRSKRINLGVSLVESEILMILDSDVLVEWSVVEHIIKEIKNNRLDAATPFENLYHVSRKIISSMKNKIDINSYLNKNKEEISRVFKVNGGCFITKTNIFKHIRGMNEFFLGWGLEDDELINRYIKLGYRYARIKGHNAIHINHERTKNCLPDPSNFENSITEKNRIYLFNKNEILKYYGISNDIGEYSSLNKPAEADSAELRELVAREINIYNNSNNNNDTAYKI
jgi:predicted glycosyltransferase involved in capsule biosynthesis